jgi:Zn-dependent peptidase ImmA (M78 family)/transcriptional regulator with XRE-family HTH domain
MEGFMRVGSPGFVPGRLVEVREARSVGTQIGLSNLVGKPQASISRWESGEATPESDALDLLAERLNVRRSHFLRPIPEHGPGAFFYRARRNIEKVVQARERARMRWLQDISFAVQHYFDFPKFDVPDFLQGQSYATLRDDDIERIALDLRSHWKIGEGPITNMVALLESRGFVVARDLVGSARLDGVCSWSNIDQRPYVLLAKDKESFFRSQMDAAHEMGHALLHRTVDQEIFDRDFKLIEEQAFRLASAFLMPSTSFPIEIRNKTLSGFIALKERWRVSAKAMIKRCSDLDILDAEAATQLYKYYSARGWNKGEPLDDLFAADNPRLLSKAIRTLVEQNTRSKADLLASEFTLPASDIEQLTGLPEGWFDQQGELVHFQLRARTGSSSGTGEVFQFPGPKR